MLNEGPSVPETNLRPSVPSVPFLYRQLEYCIQERTLGPLPFGTLILVFLGIAFMYIRKDLGSLLIPSLLSSLVYYK
jgi:hypothetical protein